MNGYPPSRPPVGNGWASFDAHDNKPHAMAAGANDASWLAELAPSNYRQALPIHTDDVRRSSSPFHHIRKTLQHQFPALSSLWAPQRTSLTRAQPEIWLAMPSADAIRFMLLCICWYSSSALSSNTGKVILNQFRYPVTLTFVQFGFVASFCLLFMSPVVQFSKLRRPTRAILKDTFPMGCFQVGGHIFSSMAISRIPVSTVHTIKALSPLFTVAAYALLFGVSYSAPTYLSLLPLTLGVMLACSFDISASNFIGLLCAFGSALVFVSSNIFFKKIMPSSSGGHGGSTNAHKLDKLNLLFYSSSMAFLVMVPIWAWTDLPNLLPSSSGYVAHPAHPGPAHSSIIPYFLANGTVHFLQNVLAFVILARTSPVTYSIASLVKRVAVICAAILWFSQRVHPVQCLGICMTFGGLYMYNRAVKKGDVDRGERKVRRIEKAWEGELPLSKDDAESDNEQVRVTPVEPYAQAQMQQSYARAHPPPRSQQIFTYSSTHPHVQPNLHIHIDPPTPTTTTKPSLGIKVETSTMSPTDSYPSPPPSLDSPPGSSAVEQGTWPVKKRRGTVSGHSHNTAIDAPRVTMVGA